MRFLSSTGIWSTPDRLSKFQTLTHFMPVISFDTLWKHEKTRGMFWGGIKRDQLHEMGLMIFCEWYQKSWSFKPLQIRVSKPSGFWLYKWLQCSCNDHNFSSCGGHYFLTRAESFFKLCFNNTREVLTNWHFQISFSLRSSVWRF